jgi:hypothetical protein
MVAVSFIGGGNRSIWRKPSTCHTITTTTAPLIAKTRVKNYWIFSSYQLNLTRRVPLVEQELPTLPEHLSSPPVFTGVRVTRSLILYVCFVDRCSYFCPFSFGHCTEAEKTLQSFMKGGISTENRAGRSLTCLLHREIQGLHCLNLI